MKRFYIALLAVAVLSLSTVKLFAQDRTISSDTSWRYTYPAGTDSAFQERVLHTKIDSGSVIVDIYLRTNELEGDWQRGTKRRELWNENELLTSSLEYTWDAALEQWNENTLMEFYVDEYGNDTLIDMSTRSGDAWIKSMVFRTVCTYNGSGQLIEEIFINGPPGGELPHRKHEYTLDASGNRISTIRYNYQTDWVLNQKVETSFNEQGLELEKITYSRSGDTWVELAKDVFVYDADYKMVLHEDYEWNTAAGEWAMTSEHIFDYNADGEWSLRTQNNYNMDGSQWGTNRDVYSYYPSGKLQVHASSMFNEETGQYISDPQKKFYSHAGDYFVHYDTICSGEVYDWEGETYMTGGTYRRSFVSATGYDSIYSLCLQENPAPASFVITGPSEVIRDQEALYIAPEDAVLSYAWEVENGTVLSGLQNDTLEVRWETQGAGEVAAWATNLHGCTGDTISVLVSIGSNGLEDLPAEELLLYPIPVKDVLRVKTSLASLQLELLDASGKVVLHAEGLEMDLSHLETGIYLVRMSNPDGQLLGTRKILKE